MRRVIFLDIDGVLNHVGWRAPAFYEAESMAELIDPATVARLDLLIERSGAEVVLSSSWRRVFSTEKMQGILELVGFRGRLRDRTPIPHEYDGAAYERLTGSPLPTPGRSVARGYEIQQWLDAHADVEGVVILDDSSQMAHLLPWLVRTSMLTGLCDEHVEQALACLQRPAPRF
jgi:hypothetical protein